MTRFAPLFEPTLSVPNGIAWLCHRRAAGEAFVSRLRSPALQGEAEVRGSRDERGPVSVRA